MSAKEQLQNAGIGFVTGAASDALGLIKGAAETKRNIRAAKELAVFNRQQQMQLWRDTNYAAQVKEAVKYRDWETDRKSTRLNSSHITRSRMPSSA